MYQGHAIVRGVHRERACKSREQASLWLGMLLVEFHAVLECTDMRTGEFRDNNTGNLIGFYTLDKE
ncbi:hypothetical protein FDI69_gp140 [Rhodococcus phage Trina]|uniref:Uncharacterized protein n=1 Tax=Rhodococcus phage Trina TaxID=2027905 RepID=A0A2D0ZMB9_9CAUD|nr:hypothetical protein FDI69_gp140 [Rhodococcus phage Trina]ASZ75045.1 hypothetical protein SEA_TRINA_267 [Rhodococcus phage Trina]